MILYNKEINIALLMNIDDCTNFPNSKSRLQFSTLFLLRVFIIKFYYKISEICGDKCNSYSKTDYDATFMRMKKGIALFYSCDKKAPLR